MSALIIVDVQNDFCSGSLAVQNSHEIIPVINKLLENYKFDLVVQTYDCHPKDHISFNDSPLVNTTEDDLLDELTLRWKGAFPSHCVEGTWGMEFVKELNTSKTKQTFPKGRSNLKEEFSGFANKDLKDYLLQGNIAKVYVCGLAYDFCVGLTAIDSSKYFETFLIEDATRGIFKDKMTEMQSNLIKNNVNIVNASEIL